MSSTRHKSEDAPMRQERFASSQEFERGLLAAMVARRCSVLDAPADRELVWWLHFMSHRDGGLKALVADLLENQKAVFVTPAMQRIGKRTGNYSADEVREIRKGLPRELRCRFLLKGEVSDWMNRIACVRHHVIHEEIYNEKAQREIANADSHPENYPVAEFIKYCRIAAESGVDHDCTEKIGCLENHLRKLCLDPALEIASASPWYSADLVSVLRAYMLAWIADRKASTVVTTLGQKVCDVLDYTAHARTMSLVEGVARIGKSYSARAWCEQHAGQARFVEVPTGNDETGFLRAVARGLGLGNFQQYKAGEIRERIESVLLTGDLLLCLDEAHRLWPEMNLRYGFPKRINWVMSMANQGVPICLIGTPQFIERQKAVEQGGWNSAQFIGRLGHYEPLPCELGLEDLMAVTKSVLPEADSQTKRALAAYASTSAKYLAAIEAIAKRARYLAERTGRTEATTADIRMAMKESVIPSDSNLVRALAVTAKASRQRHPLPQPADAPDGGELPASLPSRAITPAPAPSNRITDLIHAGN